jgi:DNA processing protein
MAPSEHLALAVNRLPYLQPLERYRLMALCPTVDGFAGLTRPDMEEILQRRFDDPGLPMEWYLQEAERDRKFLTRGRFQCTFYWTGSYPPQMREMYDPPLVLYYRGDLPDWSEPLVAIVGTRHPTGQARECAYELAFQLARLRLSTVSGLARGVDAEAHRGSTEAGGRSIAVLGCGVDILFPRSSADVGRDLLGVGGALISEYPPGEPPLARNFPARNRIISGLARTVVVVQAPLRSGALITADYALEQGRELVVHRVGTCGERGAGSRQLVDQGAAIIEEAADILSEWGWSEGHSHCGTSTLGYCNSPKSGEQLARLLEAEMDGRIIFRSGRVFERDLDGNE